MNDLVLPGLRADTLAGYLQALGLLRVLAEQVDSEIKLRWSTRDEAVLTTELTVEELTDWLVDSFEPSPVVTPWNRGSGFAANGKSKSAEGGLETVRASTQPRLSRLREVVDIADAVVDEGRKRGWEGKDFWDDKRKRDVVQLCRRRFPDAAQEWLDVSVTLTAKDIAYNPLVGTGGNFGRQDLSATYIARVLQVMDPEITDRPSKKAVRKIARSRSWVRALLLGAEDVPYERDAVGQFDPGRAGGILSSPLEKADDKGFVNPWSFLLTLEGTMFFASATTRRLGSTLGNVSWPFFVYSTPVGYSSAAEAEASKGEQWVPLWSGGARAADVTQLFGEGRVQWRGRTSRTGLEFAMGIASLGQDNGLTAFRRFVIVNRLGQNPLAVPAGRITGFRRPEARYLEQPYAWLDRLSRVPDLPAGVSRERRAAERAMYAVAATGERAALADFVIAFGRLHEAVALSGKVRAKIAPYSPQKDHDWLVHLPDEEAMWLAAGFASLRDPNGDWSLSPRALLTPVQYEGRRPVWNDRAPTGYGLAGPTLIPALAALHRLRAQHVHPATTQAKRYGADAAPSGAAAGTMPYAQGVHIPVDLAQDFILRDDAARDERTADYLRGFLALGVTRFSHARWPAPEPAPLNPVYAVLLPFHGRRRFAIPAMDDVGSPSQKAIDLTPRFDWAARLAAGDASSVAGEALRWLRISGCPVALTDHDIERSLPTSPASHQLGPRLAAGLLLRTSNGALAQALSTASTIDETKIHFVSPSSAESPEGQLA